MRTVDRQRLGEHRVQGTGAGDRVLASAGGSEHLQRSLGGGVDPSRRFIREQPTDSGGDVAQRVVGGSRDRGVARGAEQPDPQRAGPLLADGHGDRPAAVGELEQEAPALVEREVAGRGPAARGRATTSRRRRCCAPRPPRRRARRRRPGARPLRASVAKATARAATLALHVGGTAAEQQPVAKRSLERRHRPARGRRRDDVGVAHQHQRRALTPTRYPGDEVEALAVGAVSSGSIPAPAQVGGEQPEQPASRCRAASTCRPGSAPRASSTTSWSQVSGGHHGPRASHGRAGSGRGSCIVPSRKGAGSAATRQL